MLKKLIILAGPTASGKTNLAIKLAEKINGEIINADSMQVFKEFSVLSSRPTLAQTRKIKHHLYGIITVKKHFSAGDWLKQVKKKIDIWMIRDLINLLGLPWLRRSHKTNKNLTKIFIFFKNLLFFQKINKKFSVNFSLFRGFVEATAG